MSHFIENSKTIFCKSIFSEQIITPKSASFFFTTHPIFRSTQESATRNVSESSKSTSAFPHVWLAFIRPNVTSSWRQTRRASAASSTWGQRLKAWRLSFHFWGTPGWKLLVYVVVKYEVDVIACSITEYFFFETKIVLIKQTCLLQIHFPKNATMFVKKSSYFSLSDHFHRLRFRHLLVTLSSQCVGTTRSGSTTLETATKYHPRSKSLTIIIPDNGSPPSR